MALNERLKTEGKAPVKVVELPDALEDEDALEMLDAGLLELTVVDDWKARCGRRSCPRSRCARTSCCAPKASIGWAFRKDSPKLAGVLDGLLPRRRQEAGRDRVAPGAAREARQALGNNTAERRVEALRGRPSRLFEKYGAQYGFDPLMLAAQGYQESQLRQDARSHVGAIGVMQIMPATGKELRVGDIHQLEPNIHGGAKYMDQLMTRYFEDAKFSEQDRTLFAFASYNAGPGNISRMREEAAKRGPRSRTSGSTTSRSSWRERIGMETTTYVRNIYKYYVAYKLALDAQEAARKAREQATPRELGTAQFLAR